MDALSALSMALGAAWASGLNLYATVLIIGALGGVGLIDLPPDLQVLATPPVLIVAGVLCAVEFLADKVPGVDSLNDALHTFIRIPAGALLAMGSVSGVAEPWQMAAALVLGGVVTAGTHAAKAGTRALINISPEPFSNWAASIAEDFMVMVGLLLALFKPTLFLLWMAAFALFLIWFLPKLWRGLKGLYRAIAGVTGSATGPGGAQYGPGEGRGRALVRALAAQPAPPGGPMPPTLKP